MRAGLRRTTPRREKWARPSNSSVSGSDVDGISHGVESSCAAMHSSMLASPHGALVL